MGEGAINKNRIFYKKYWGGDYFGRFSAINLGFINMLFQIM